MLNALSNVRFLVAKRTLYPDVIAEYVRTYHEERKRLATAADANRSRLQRQVNQLTAEN